MNAPRVADFDDAAEESSGRPEGRSSRAIGPGRGGLSLWEFQALVQARHQEVFETVARTMTTTTVLDDPGEASIPTAGEDVVTGEARRAARMLGGATLADVLETRRSATASTTLGTISLPELFAVLSRSYRVQDAGLSVNGTPWTVRPVPSAGATHPFELVVDARGVVGLPSGRYVFDAHRAGLRVLHPSWQPYAEVLDAAVLRASRRPQMPAATVCLIAQVERVTRRYSAALTLLLRDAGVLAHTMHLVATDVGLGSSLIGSGGQLGPSSRTDYGVLFVNCGAIILGR